ncbi:ABC transporter ATP-binding protein [Megalodesulfovibrio paquesii]
MFLHLRGLSKTYPASRTSAAQAPCLGLLDISLDVHPGELLSCIGPSGAGKTTLLKCIAGLEQPDAGSIQFATAPSRQHPVILVFQDFLLFPHLTVFENVAFGLRARALPRREIETKVLAMLECFGLADKPSVYPAHLSAGQKQRVAIARAMVVEPALLLLDEPFANLDRNLKLQTALFIRETQRRFGVTTISVTHDLEEAFAMSDRLALLLDGRLIQCGTAQELYHSPATAEAAAFLGPVNTIPPALQQALEWPVRAEPLLLRPEALHLEPAPDGPAVVEAATFAGHFWKYQLRAVGHSLLVYSTMNGCAPGDRVRVLLRPSFPQPFAPEASACADCSAC